MSIWSIFWGDQFHLVDPVYSGLIQFPYSFWVFPDWIGSIRSFSAPGMYHSFWPPDPDEGSPTGCLWWSLRGGEVTYMHHISRGRCEP